jgi:serine/threonine protein kinase
VGIAAVQSMIPRLLSHYEMIAPIGEGGMGVVYRAVDTRLGRPVAVKLLRSDSVITTESRKRFVHEARAASALNHPHIVTIYDVGREANVDFIAMEYVAGLSLAAHIAQGRLSVADSVRYGIQIADALAAAHAAGILHRDLKPANIMVNQTGAIKVLDFGLAKLTEPVDGDFLNEPAATATASDNRTVSTVEGTILGTAAYMSPEQAEGKPADTRSDVFSFGAVLYEMITGRRAFDGASKISTLSAVLTKEPDPPSRTVAGLPVDLEKLILRCLRKSPERRWQSMADVKVALQDVREDSDSHRPVALPPPPQPHRSRATPFIVLAVLVAGTLLGALWLATRPPPDVAARPFLTRLTSDVGWTDFPAISPDGKMLAYSSDRSGEGNLDIWVQQLPDGPPVRVTRDAADDIDPSFSADGSRLAFQSSRLEGGIYIVSTLGGEERLLAAHGFSPRFSPDGKWIAYGVANQAGGQLYVAPAGGGPASPVAAGFYRTQAPVWSPDGRHLLFWGQRDRDAATDGHVDWYITEVPAGPPTPTEARRILLPEHFRASHGLPVPDAWAPGDDRILFHGSIGDASNLWAVGIARASMKVRAPPQRVTFGTTDEAAASVASSGQIVFISRTMGADIWSLPLDPNRGRVDGQLKRVTQDAADDYDPTISADAATLVYRSRRAGWFAVVLKKLGTSTETVLTRLAQDHYPAISRDGTKVAYSFRQNDKMPMFVVPVSGGTPEQVCDDCGEVEDWSADSRHILYVTARDPSGVGMLTVGSSHNDMWLQDPGYGIYNPRFSSDGNWVAFNGRANRLAPARVFVARVQGAAVTHAKDWIVVSTDGDAPNWSPDGNLLYFWSDRDGSPCLWAQRLEAAKQPVSAPFPIEHFHSRGLSWRNLYLGAPGIAVARDKILFNLGEHTGNIWMTQLPRARE